MDEQNIGKLSRFMGVSPHTIKYYEKIGLLHSERDEHSNYRRYDLLICTDLGECVRYRGMGFSLKDLDTIMKTADSDTHLEMVGARRQEVKEELERLTCLYHFLTDYEEDCRRLDEELGEWYVEPCNLIFYIRLQTKSLTFTEENIGDDSVNIMDFAPRTTGVVALTRDYLEGGEQDFSWGQSLICREPHEQLEGHEEFIRLAPKKIFVTYRRYTGAYVKNGEMAEDIRQIFHRYSPVFPAGAYAFRLKIVHDAAGSAWHYFKIVIPLKERTL